MKRAITLISLLLPWHVVLASNFEAEGFITIVAKKLQSNLPSYSVDGLFQAKRASAKWEYSFWIEAEKAWVTEVRINIKQINAFKTFVDVNVVKIKGGLLSSSEENNGQLSKIWAEKIKEILNSPNQSFNFD